MVDILVHRNDHFILSGPHPTKPLHCRWCGTGPSSKLVRQNRRLSASGTRGFAVRSPSASTLELN